MGCVEPSCNEMRSWHEALTLFVWKPSFNRKHCNSLQKDLLVYFLSLCWPRQEILYSQFNWLFHLGVKEVGDIVDAQFQRILEFVEVWQLLCILPNHGFIYERRQTITLMQGRLSLQIEEQSRVDCLLQGHMSLLQVTTKISCIVTSFCLFSGFHLRLNKNGKHITMNGDDGRS